MVVDKLIIGSDAVLDKRPNRHHLESHRATVSTEVILSSHSESFQSIPMQLHNLNLKLYQTTTIVDPIQILMHKNVKKYS